MRGVHVLALTALARAAAGCGADVGPQQLEPWWQWEIRVTVSPPEPIVIALAVDDRPTGEAAVLRATVGEALRISLAMLDGAASRGDPAAWRPVDWTVVLALPSVLGSERLIGPQQMPAFAHQPRYSTAPAAMALADAVLAEMETRLAAAGAPYRPIEAAAQLGQLLAGARPPLDEREAALIEATARHQGVYIGEVLATTSDDESPGAVTAYPMPPWSGDEYYLYLAAVIPSDQPTPCYFFDPAAEPPSRIQSWIAALPPYTHVQGWPCAAEELVKNGLWSTVSCSGGRQRCSYGGRGWCTSHPIAMQGPQAECLVLAESYAVDSPCDPERGWRDPLDEDGVRRPRLGRNERYRVCEVTQLEREALDACRTTSACEDCPSGWCRAEWLGEEDLGGSYDWCAPGQYAAQLRFVGGAMAGAHAAFRVICNLIP